MSEVYFADDTKLLRTYIQQVPDLDVYKGNLLMRNIKKDPIYPELLKN